jgi:hypothetical protein
MVPAVRGDLGGGVDDLRRHRPLRGRFEDQRVHVVGRADQDEAFDHSPPAGEGRVIRDGRGQRPEPAGVVPPFPGGPVRPAWWTTIAVSTEG